MSSLRNSYQKIVNQAWGVTDEGLGRSLGSANRGVSYRAAFETESKVAIQCRDYNVTIKHNSINSEFSLYEVDSITWGITPQDFSRVRRGLTDTTGDLALMGADDGIVFAGTALYTGNHLPNNLTLLAGKSYVLEFTTPHSFAMDTIEYFDPTFVPDDSPVVLPVWLAATSSAYALGTGSSEFKAQLIGAGTPTFTTSELLLPDSDGVYVTIPANTMPVHGARWDGGVPYTDDLSGTELSVQPSLYAAEAATNVCLYSNDQSNAYWNKDATVSQDQDGLTGAANTATLTTDDSVTVTEAVTKSYVIANDSNSVCVRYIVKKDSDETRFPSFQLRVSGGTEVRDNVRINTATGAIDVHFTNNGDGVYEVEDLGLWWGVMIQATNNSTGNTSASLSVTPAGSATDLDGPTEVTATGSVIVGNIELHTGKTLAEVRGLAPIITVGSTVTTTAVDIDYDIANHDDNQGAYYCEYTSINSWDDIEQNSDTAIISLVSGTNYGPLGFINYTGTEGRITSHDSSYTRSHFANDFLADEPSKIGVAYSDDGRVVNVDGTEGNETTHSGEFPTGAVNYDYIALLAQNPSVRIVRLIRNVQRYDLAYDDAKAKLVELMT